MEDVSSERLDQVVRRLSSCPSPPSTNDLVDFPLLTISRVSGLTKFSCRVKFCTLDDDFFNVSRGELCRVQRLVWDTLEVIRRGDLENRASRSGRGEVTSVSRVGAMSVAGDSGAGSRTRGWMERNGVGEAGFVEGVSSEDRLVIYKYLSFLTLFCDFFSV